MNAGAHISAVWICDTLSTGRLGFFAQIWSFKLYSTLNVAIAITC